MRIPARPVVRDAVVAAAAAVVVGVGSWRAAAVQQPPRPLDVWAFLLVAAAAGALTWRRSAPLVALTGSAGATAAYLAVGYSYGPVLLCVAWAMFEVARRLPMRRSVPAGAVAALGLVIAALPRLADNMDLLAVGLLLWAGTWLVVPWLAGALVHVRAVAAEQARRDLVARAALEERVRISREVHDVAGHGFAVVAMQAGVALVVLDEQPEQVRASLEAIRATSVQALQELRTVLDTVAPTHSGAPPASDAQRTDRLAALVDRARAAGLPVELRAAEAIPAGLSGVVHGVVREALTNVLRHAGPAEAVVTVGREGADLVVTVTDQGRGGAVADGGRGLSGMRDRVEGAGGTLAAGPLETGGFEVTVRLPLPGGAA
ncbi:MAG TPA: histidine kinase [Pilimelia sp.]|nr:histidine kinase [Pilimelia sp.]